MLKNYANETHLPEATKNHAQLPPGFYKKYSKTFPKEVRPFQMGHLKNVGLPDPFAGEEKPRKVKGKLP